MIIRRKNITRIGYPRVFFKKLISKDWASGVELESFQAVLSRQYNRHHAICTSYGLHALSIALRYYGFNTGAKLFVPSYTALVIHKLLDQMRVDYVCVDIDPRRATISLEDLELKFHQHPDVQGILMTHLLGNSCTDSVFEFASHKGLVIIEDCAHLSPCATSTKKSHAVFLSFGYAKLLNTFTGGVLLTDDEGLYQFANQDLLTRSQQSRGTLLRKFLTGHIEILLTSWPFMFFSNYVLKSQRLLRKMRKILFLLTRKKIDRFQRYSNTLASIGLYQLTELPNVIDRKKKEAEHIIKHTTLEYLEKTEADVYYMLIALVSDAKKYHDFLISQGVDTAYGEDIAVVLEESKDFTGAMYANNHYLGIPNHSDLSEENLKKVIESLNKAHSLLK